MSFIRIAILFTGLACVAANFNLPPVAENQVPPEGGKIILYEAEEATPRFLSWFPDLIMKPIARTIGWALEKILRVIGRILSFLLPDKILKEMLPPELYAFINNYVRERPRPMPLPVKSHLSYLINSGGF